MEILRYWTVAVWIAMVLGCGKSQPQLKPAPRALITINGSPTQGLSVRLVGSDGQAVGGGASGEDGHAVLRGPTDEPIQPGTYKVIVEDLGDAEENPMAIVSAKAKAKSRISTKYQYPNSTPLTITIESGKLKYDLAIKG